MLQKCVRSVALLAMLLSIGCSRDGVLEAPDGGITVTTLEAIHGKTGHLVEFTIGNKADDVTDQVVVQLQDNEITGAVLYLSLAHTLNNNTSVAELISLLKRATNVSLTPALPDGIKQRGGVILSFGDKSDPSFLIYLRIVTSTDTQYWSVRGNLGTDRRDWFLTEVRKPPKVIDTRPAQVVDIAYYLDELLTQPIVSEGVFVGDTVYTKVVFSKDVPIVIADDDRARPHISLIIGPSPQESRYRAPRSSQYRMKPRGDVLASGDVQPYGNTGNIFVGMYQISAHDLRTEFSASVGFPPIFGSGLQVRFYKYDDNDIPSNTGTTITERQPDDFVGQVFTAQHGGRVIDRSISVPLPGVVVTIMTGPRSGESTVTDRNGRYRFLNISGNSLHLRADRPYFEPKEVIVHRSQPTTLLNGSVPNYFREPQKEPGNILIGQAWPDEVRFILEETLLPHDLLYLEYGRAIGNRAGSYAGGLVILYSESLSNPSDVLAIFAHELAHAHQHAIASIDGSASTPDAWSLWLNSPEGKAFAAARAKDWEEVGMAEYDHDPYFRDRLHESAAEIAAHYWGVRSGQWTTPRGNFREVAPNRYQWATEWLPKK